MDEVASVDLTLDQSTRVGTVTFARGRENRIDADLLERLVLGLDKLAAAGARALLLRSGTPHFCAGADIQQRPVDGGGRHLYDFVPALFDLPVPVVAALDGAAVGAGLGLAVAADFRVATPRARFWANFARLGFSQGFALSVTLPRLLGPQHAADLLYTGRRIDGAEAARIGLADRLVEPQRLEAEATALAEEIAGSAPLAVAAIRRTLRADLVVAVPEALAAERRDQDRLFRTEDFREGLRAARDRRSPRFQGA